MYVVNQHSYEDVILFSVNILYIQGLRLLELIQCYQWVLKDPLVLYTRCPKCKSFHQSDLQWDPSSEATRFHKKKYI